MKIVIKNTPFEFDLGCKVLKMLQDTCPFEELSDFWGDIKPLTFREIAKISNLEQRRIALGGFGMENLINSVKPTLINETTLNKITTWVDSNGKRIEKTFADTYRLFKVDKSVLYGENAHWENDVYYVECKDTSTDRRYLIWIDEQSVKRTNEISIWSDRPINSIQAIAWTIQTNVPQGKIKRIIRQGDCILIEPKNKDYTPLEIERHLTEKEYKTLLKLES
jgi:hypothetical protein